MEEVRSYDIFDTLLARTVPNPTDIFGIVEQQTGYPRFQLLRLEAQARSNQHADDIWKKFQELTNESPLRVDELRETEMQAELANTIAIRSNILRLRPQDILVSDMYYSAAELARLLQHHGIWNDRIFVSPGGKHSGDMWVVLNHFYKIEHHVGDNARSDVEMAHKHGIPATLTTLHAFTPLESRLDGSLRRLFRTFRLGNPHPEGSLEYKLYDQQARLNIPFMVYVCHRLKQILCTERRTTVLFLTRDGCLVQRLFQWLFPHFQAISLESSRRMNRNPTDGYRAYLRSTYHPGCVLFDLQGSFESGRALFLELFGHYPRIFFVDFARPAMLFPEVTYVATCSDVIESLNHDCRGPLVDYTDRPLRGPMEYPYRLIRIMHDAVEAFMQPADHHALCSTHALFTDDVFWGSYYRFQVSTADRVLPVHAPVHPSLIDLAKKYRVVIHPVYQELISDVLARRPNPAQPFALLDHVPRLHLWNEYFFGLAILTGVAPHGGLFEAMPPHFRIVYGGVQKLQGTTYDLITASRDHLSTLWPLLREGGCFVIEPGFTAPSREYLETLTTNIRWEESMIILHKC